MRELALRFDGARDADLGDHSPAVALVADLDVDVLAVVCGEFHAKICGLDTITIVHLAYT